MEEWSDTIYVAGLPADVTEDRCAPNAFFGGSHKPLGPEEKKRITWPSTAHGIIQRMHVAPPGRSRCVM